jgi:hypothetical protein
VLRFTIATIRNVMIMIFFALVVVQRRGAAIGHLTASKRSTDMAAWKKPDCIPKVVII